MMSDTNTNLKKLFNIKPYHFRRIYEKPKDVNYLTLLRLQKLFKCNLNKNDANRLCQLQFLRSLGLTTKLNITSNDKYAEDKGKDEISKIYQILDVYSRTCSVHLITLDTTKTSNCTATTNHVNQVVERNAVDYVFSPGNCLDDGNEDWAPKICTLLDNYCKPLSVKLNRTSIEEFYNMNIDGRNCNSSKSQFIEKNMTKNIMCKNSNIFNDYYKPCYVKLNRFDVAYQFSSNQIAKNLQTYAIKNVHCNVYKTRRFKEVSGKFNSIEPYQADITSKFPIVIISKIIPTVNKYAQKNSNGKVKKTRFYLRNSKL